MFKFFKRIRRRLIGEGKLKRYLIYALGEIILVVVGILIALQINNWNVSRVEHKEEIAILKGIKENILQDTIDMNYNIGVYKFNYESDSIFLKSLTETKEYDKKLARNLYTQYTNSLQLILHQSSFEEAKSRGLKIISNPELRNNISRLYEFHYVYLLKSENDTDGLIFDSFNQYLMDNKLLHLEDFDNETGLTISFSENKHQLLLEDKHFHFLLGLKMMISKAMLNSRYYPVRQKALDLVEKIEEELERLE